MFSSTECQWSDREKIHSLNTIILRETVDQIQLKQQFEKPKRCILRHCSQILDDYQNAQYKFLLERRLLKSQKIDGLTVRQRRFSCNCTECGQQSKKVRRMYQTYLESPQKRDENAGNQKNKILLRRACQKPMNTMKWVSKPSFGQKEHECKESPRKSIKIVRRQSDNNAWNHQQSQQQQPHQKLKIYNSYRASLLNNLLEQSNNNSGMRQMHSSPISYKLKTQQIENANTSPIQSSYRYSCKKTVLNTHQSSPRKDYSNTNISENRVAFIIGCYISQNKQKRIKGKF